MGRREEGGDIYINFTRNLHSHRMEEVAELMGCGRGRDNMAAKEKKESFDHFMFINFSGWLGLARSVCRGVRSNPLDGCCHTHLMGLKGSVVLGGGANMRFH